MLNLDVSTFLIIAQRELSDAKDVVQTVFIRAVYDMMTLDERIQEQSNNWRTEEEESEDVLHFDLCVH